MRKGRLKPGTAETVTIAQCLARYRHRKGETLASGLHGCGDRARTLVRDVLRVARAHDDVRLVEDVLLVLGRDPEVRYTPGGIAVVNVSLATTSVYTDKSGERQEDTELQMQLGRAAQSLVQGGTGVTGPDQARRRICLWECQ